MLVTKHSQRNNRITAFVLGLVALFLLAISFVLFGMGTFSPTFLMGLGIFPYLGGALTSFIACGVLCGMCIFSAISAVRGCQKEQWAATWKRRQIKNVKEMQEVL